MSKWKFPLLVAGLMLASASGRPWGQTVPDAPAAPTCSWDGGGSRSNCKFKDAMTGTATSLVGKKVILFDHSASGGGHRVGRDSLRSAFLRLAGRYGFTAVTSQDPALFTAANLADARVVIMANGDGDVVPPGANRVALENFQQVSGWGMIWIHAACTFITSGWPFARQSCVELYWFHNASGTRRRVFIDSGTSAIPNQGRKNPQSEFLLRDLPGWGGNRALEMSDEWFCFRAPARNTAGVNVLFGYDRGSGRPSPSCLIPNDASETASQSHNLAWTRSMGKGISIVNSWGHDSGTYVDHGNMGDSLLWRYIRYAAKDWCVGGSGEPGCDAPTAVGPPETLPETRALRGNGSLALSLAEAGRLEVSLRDVGGKRVFFREVTGPGRLEIPGLRRGLYLLRIRGKAYSRNQRIMVY